MDAKEIAVSASIIAGGTGAGGATAYAVNSTGLRFNAHNTQIPPAELDPSSCVGKLFPQGGLSSLMKDASISLKDKNTTNDLGALSEQLEADEGCLNVYLMSDSSKQDEKYLNRISFEFSAWNKEKNKGVFIWSVLSKPKDKVGLVSWVFYVEKNEKLETKKGWVLTSELDNDSTISGLKGANNPLNLSKIFKGSDSYQASSEDVISSLASQRYVWSGTSGSESPLDKIKIGKGSNYALFFGRDFPTNNVIKADIKAVYKQASGWSIFDSETADVKDITKSLFKSGKRGVWNEFKEV